MAETQTGILIAGVPSRLRDSLRTLLVSFPDFRIADIANSWSSAMAAFDMHPIDVVIVDSSLPGEDAWNLLRSLRILKDSRKDIRSLFLADNSTLYAKGKQAGADMVLLKGFTGEELCHIIQGISRTPSRF